MTSTYTTNNGFEKIGTGEQSGTWGYTTNTNFDLIGESLDGQVAVTLPATGSTGTPNDIPVTDGASSDGRNRFIDLVDGGDLGATAYVRLTPNDAEKIIFIRNSLSASRAVIVFQGTYNASNYYQLDNGYTAALKFDGAGTGAVVQNVFANIDVTAINGFVIGTDVQAYDATLTSIAALGTSGQIAYTTGTDTWAEAPISAFGRSIIDDADAAAVLTTLGVDTDVATLALPANTTISAFGRTLVDDAAASDARTTLGLGTAATTASTAYATAAQGTTADAALARAGGTMTGRQTSLTIRDTNYSLTGTVIDAANGDAQYKTLSGNTTFTENLSDGDSVELFIDDGTDYTVTWPTITWDDAAPTLLTTGYTRVILEQMNGVVYGSVVAGG